MRTYADFRTSPKQKSPDNHSSGPRYDSKCYLLPWCDALGEDHHVVVQVFYYAALDEEYFFLAGAAHDEFTVLERGDDGRVMIQYFEAAHSTGQAHRTYFAFEHFFVGS